MFEAKAFKLTKEFSSCYSLCDYLRGNIDHLETMLGLKFEKPFLKTKNSFVTKEKITRRNVLFYIFEKDLIENLGGLVFCSFNCDADVVIIFMTKEELKSSPAGCIHWLQKISNDDCLFILCEISA